MVAPFVCQEEYHIKCSAKNSWVVTAVSCEHCIQQQLAQFREMSHAHLPTSRLELISCNPEIDAFQQVLVEKCMSVERYNPRNHRQIAAWMRSQRTRNKVGSRLPVIGTRLLAVPRPGARSKVNPSSCSGDWLWVWTGPDGRTDAEFAGAGAVSGTGATCAWMAYNIDRNPSKSTYMQGLFFLFRRMLTISHWAGFWWHRMHVFHILTKSILRSWTQCLIC